MSSDAKANLSRGLTALTLALVVGASGLSAAPGDVVINEIMQNPSAVADSVGEWFEIVNVTGAAIDINGWTIQDNDFDSHVIANGGPLLVPAGGFLVLGNNSNSGTNGGVTVAYQYSSVFLANSSDELVLIDNLATEIDRVEWDDGATFPDPNGASMSLVDPALDNSVGANWCTASTPFGSGDFGTPGAPNDCAPATPELVINEIDYDQPGTDAAEFVEIKNVGSGSVDLSGIELQLVNGSGGGAVVYDTIALSGTLAAGDYYVVCANAATVANCDLDDAPDTNFIQNGAPDAVALFQGTTLLDAVSYEGDTGAPFTEGSGSGLEDDPGFADRGISRCPDGADTDQNNADLTFAPITPGAANDCPAPPAAELVINEIDYDQPGTDTAEFVEIKNVGSSAVDLTGYSLVFVNGSGGAVYDTIALSGTLAAGDYYVVCANAATVFGCDLDDGPDTNFIQNGSPDAVALTLGGVIIDTVSYEGDVPGYTEGSGSGLFDSSSADNLGLSRFPDGVDTNQNNVDLSLRCITPGAANTSASSSCPTPGPPQVVINEIDYDQPGADTAEFVEIYNAGNGAADLGGLVLELVNGSTGSAYQSIGLPSVTLASGDFFVVCSNAATVANCDLDAITSIQNGSPDAVALIFQGVIVDTVSYEGDTAGFTEGSGSGLFDSGSSGEDFKGISRVPNGVDTDQNNVDFSNVCITPGGPNSSVSIGCSNTGPVLEIFQIQGSGSSTPFAGETVRTNDNAVTAVAPDGFFIQTPAARTDSDVDTSDGIFVFTAGPPGVAEGDRVDVTGTASEFFNFTEISFATVTVVGTGAVPAPVIFDATVPSPDPTAPSCAIEFECYEGMLIEITGGTVTGPNQRFGTDPIAEVHITAASSRTFREPGIEFPGIAGFPVWDGNPEVFELDPNKLGLPNLIIPGGSSFDAVGVLGFEFGGYELFPKSLTVVEAVIPRAVRAREAGEFTVGTLNLFRLFDDVDDPPSVNFAGETRNDSVESTAEYLTRRAKFASYILDVLDAPDILAVQEAEKLGVLEDLAADIAALNPAVVYTAYLEEGNDVGTIDVGFLVRDTIAVDAVTQLGLTETYINPLNGMAEVLNDRPPLLLEGRCIAGGANSPIAVIAVHGRSLGGIEGSEGERVRQKRYEQAQSLAQKVQDLQSADPDIRLVVTGDFNAFEFTDGYVDVVGQIKGDFVPSDNLVCDTSSCDDLVDPNLVNVVDTVIPAEERYSFIFRGDAQVLDHALYTDALGSLVTGAEYGRGNADAAVDLINDGSTPLRSSDHDGLVVFMHKDSDNDGVIDPIDVCADTAIPESVPTQYLGNNRYALVDGDTIFDTPGSGPQITIEDTAGCSCEQIIVGLGLGQGHVRFGCSRSVMEAWIDLVNP